MKSHIFNYITKTKMTNLKDHKRRILSTRGDIETDKTSYLNLAYNNNFAGTMHEIYLHKITPEEINEYLRTVINIPTVLARNSGWRWMLHNRSSYYMSYRSNIIDKEVKEVLEQYFDWLKQRDDYVESPKDKIVRIERERITARANAVRQEILEAVYHPDRCERMMNEYGEIWADIHMPY